MSTKSDAIKYLVNRISNDKSFAKKALAQLIDDAHCNSATFQAAGTRIISDGLAAVAWETWLAESVRNGKSNQQN